MYGNVVYEKQWVAALLLFSIFSFEYRRLYFYRYATQFAQKKKKFNIAFFCLSIPSDNGYELYK